MGDAVTIRLIEPGDADGYLAVFETVAAEGRWIGTELPIDAPRQSRIRAAATAPADNQFTVVAVAEERVVGFAQVDVDAAIPISAWRSSADFRGQGLGRKLLDECIAWSGDYGAHKIDLEVWPHNTAARRLYERAGFVVEGRRRRHWRRNSGELWDSIEMSLVLDETSAGSPHEADG